MGVPVAVKSTVGVAVGGKVSVGSPGDMSRQGIGYSNNRTEVVGQRLYGINKGAGKQ